VRYLLEEDRPLELDAARRLIFHARKVGTMPEGHNFDNPRFDSASHTNGKGEGRARRLEKIPALDAADSVELQIEVLKESHEQLLKVIEANEWSDDEGLRTVLLTGLGYLNTQLQLEQVNRLAAAGDPEAAKQMDAMVRELAAYHSMYSVMKFKAFKLYKVNQVLEFNVSGLRATEQMWEGWADRMRRQHAEQQAELLRLRSLMSEFKIDWDPQAGVAADDPLPAPEPAVVESEAATENVTELEPMRALPQTASFWGRLRWLFTGK
jgi:hypothetical protein